MCRWLAFQGAPIYLDEIVFKPDHSLIDQSLAATAGESATNGDGFGIGWYDSREYPGVFRDIHPAWNDGNLRSLTEQIRSPMFFAHVRAATGSPVQRTNCHPFSYGNWLFVHNGVIRGFDVIRRDLMLEVAPELFSEIRGTTDSEVMFYLALTFGLPRDPVVAMARMVGFVEATARANGIDDPIEMTAGLMDGKTLYAFRYGSDGQTSSLFHSKSVEALRELHPEFERFSLTDRAIVSEPLTDLTDFWVKVPESSVLTVQHGDIEARPFRPLCP